MNDEVNDFRFFFASSLCPPVNNIHWLQREKKKYPNFKKDRFAIAINNASFT